MKTKSMFMILASVFSIDFILTAVLLNFYTNTMEANPIARFFFEKGFWGFVLFYTLTLIILFLFSFFVKRLSHNEYNKNPELTEKIGILTFVILELYAIINNFLILMGL